MIKYFEVSNILKIHNKRASNCFQKNIHNYYHSNTTEKTEDFLSSRKDIEC